MLWSCVHLNALLTKHTAKTVTWKQFKLLLCFFRSHSSKTCRHLRIAKSEGHLSGLASWVLVWWVSREHLFRRGGRKPPNDVVARLGTLPLWFNKAGLLATIKFIVSLASNYFTFNVDVTGETAEKKEAREGISTASIHSQRTTMNSREAFWWRICWAYKRPSRPRMWFLLDLILPTISTKGATQILAFSLPVGPKTKSGSLIKYPNIESEVSPLKPFATSVWLTTRSLLLSPVSTLPQATFHQHDQAAHGVNMLKRVPLTYIQSHQQEQSIVLKGDNLHGHIIRCHGARNSDWTIWWTHTRANTHTHTPCHTNYFNSQESKVF